MYKEYIDKIERIRGKHNIPENEYFEMHHILPRYAGGEGDYKNGNFRKRSLHENCIWLYADEHYIAHMLYAKDHPEDYYAQLAWEGMAYRKCNDGRDYFVTAEEFKDIKEAISRGGMSEEQKIKIGNANRGRVYSDDARKHFRDGQINRNKTIGPTPRTKEWNKKVSDGVKLAYKNMSEAKKIEKAKKTSEKLKGRTQSKESNLKRSVALKGVKRGPMSSEHIANNVASRKANNDLSLSAKKAWETRRKNGTAFGSMPGTEKAVRCIETGEVYKSMKSASRAVHGNVGRAIKTGGKAGGYHWEVIDNE